MKSLIRFISTVIAIAIVLALALLILDFTAYAHKPENATAYAVVTGVRNLFPEDSVAVYDLWRARLIGWFQDVLNLAESQT
ncbi:MAG: hypothetical protein Q4C13_03335 [Clostridia bacterium]|nr:hypothetical protein [Clostridia bacterium]